MLPVHRGGHPRGVEQLGRLPGDVRGGAQPRPAHGAGDPDEAAVYPESVARLPRSRAGGALVPRPLSVPRPRYRWRLSGGRARLFRPGRNAPVTRIMATSEKYLRPEVIRQVARLDLRAKFIVE